MFVCGATHQRLCILRDVVGRASFQGAAETHTGNVRDRNEDAHFMDAERGIFAVFDGMGGNAGGEIASALASATLADRWGHESTQRAVDAWLRLGTATSRRVLIDIVKAGVKAAHDAIVAAANTKNAPQGLGTTVVGALAVGCEVMLAFCGDSRAYLVRDGQAIQLTEDHTLLQRLISAGIDVDMANDGSRWNNVLTKALGLDKKFDAAVCFVPVAHGDRIVLCSDGITQYVQTEELPSIVGKSAPPSAAAKRLVDIALARGGSDNATAIVTNVIASGAGIRSAASLQSDLTSIAACPLWGKAVSFQQQLRVLRMALPRSIAAGIEIPPQELDERLAWIVLDGYVEQDGQVCGPGTLLYPESLLAERRHTTGSFWWRARSEVRALALLERDFRDVCEEDSDLADKLMASLTAMATVQSARALDPLDSARPSVRPGDARVHARGSRPPVDQRGFAQEGAAESPLKLALAAFAEEQSEPEITIEPWLDAVTHVDRDPSDRTTARTFASEGAPPTRPAGGRK